MQSCSGERPHFTAPLFISHAVKAAERLRQGLFPNVTWALPVDRMRRGRFRSISITGKAERLPMLRGALRTDTGAFRNAQKWHKLDCRRYRERRSNNVLVDVERKAARRQCPGRLGWPRLGGADSTGCGTTEGGSAGFLVEPIRVGSGR